MIVEYYKDGKLISVGCDTLEEGKAYHSKDKDKLIEELPPQKDIID